MKKYAVILVLSLLLTGCSAPAAPTAPTPPVTQAPTLAPTQAQTTPPTTMIPTENPTEIPSVSLEVYVPNENADGWNVSAVELPGLDPQLIVLTLAGYGVLNEETALNTFEQVDNQINLDFTDAFLTQLQTYGTAGERMMIGSVVNTFLTAYEADSVFITVNGEIMESGHVIYDFPMSFFE